MSLHNRRILKTRSFSLARISSTVPMIRMPSSNPLSIRDLGDYSAGKSRKRSDTKSGFEELSHALHILGGYPTVDMYRRRLTLQEKAKNRLM